MPEKIRGIESPFTKPMRLLKRNITEKDKEDLNALATILQKEEGSEVVPESYGEFFDKHKVTYIVRDRDSPDRKIIGAGSIREFGGNTKVLFNVVIHPEYERKGIGTSIITALLEYARSRNTQTVTLASTESAAEFYEKLGFVFSHTSRYTGRPMYMMEL